MLTKTSLSAIRALTYLGRSRHAILPPRLIAAALDESPTYLAQIMRRLVKAGLLRAVKGVKGGVQFSRPPGEISLLAIVEACQGVTVGDYCRDGRHAGSACAYHQAMVELHKAITGVLSRWNLAQVIDRPKPHRHVAGRLACRLSWEEAEPGSARESRPRG